MQYERKCEVCEGVYFTSRSTQRYCSRKCRDVKENKRTQEKRSQEQLLSKTCLYCKQEFLCGRGHRKKDSVYCSAGCQSKNWKESHTSAVKEYARNYEQINQEVRRAYRKSYTAANFDKNKAAALLVKYNITRDEFDEMLLKQDYKCALCSKEFGDGFAIDNELAVDHCHKTKIIRGLIHQSCNKLIGHAFDDAGLLLLAADYLERHNAIPGPDIYEYEGKHYTILSASKTFKIPLQTLKSRLARSWSFKDSVTIPVKRTGSRDKRTEHSKNNERS